MSTTFSPTDFHLLTTQNITPTAVNKVGKAYIVDQTVFPVLDGVTCYTLEIWDESMRLPHWHPNATELGYVISGQLEIMLWRSPGETAVFTLTAGMCWFIPQAALHSLNNIGDKPAQLLVGFSSAVPQDIDLPVAWNGIPAPLRDSYTSPHQALLAWQGMTQNPLVGKYQNLPILNQVLTASPYGFDLNSVTPLFKDTQLGAVSWAIKSNWNILEKISILRAQLMPGVARDAIWYPDAGTLYVVARGSANFYIIMAGQQPEPITVKQFDYIYIPTGTLHSFINTSNTNFEVIAFLNKADPLPEVSLSVSTAFFPNIIRQNAMINNDIVNNPADPLKFLNYTSQSPYLIAIDDKYKDRGY